MKDPLRTQSGQVARIDFRKSAEAASRIVSVVGDPIGGGRLNQKILGADVGMDDDGCGHACGSGIARKRCPASENDGDECGLPDAKAVPQIRNVNLTQPPTEASQALPPGHGVFAGETGDSVLDIPAPVKCAIPQSELPGRAVAAARLACVPWAL